MTYDTEDAVTLTDLKLFPEICEESDRSRCGAFCGVELVVGAQQPGEGSERVRLSRCEVQAFAEFQRFLRLLHPFLLEDQLPVRIGQEHRRLSDQITLPSPSPGFQDENQELLVLRVVSNRAK